MSAYHAPRSAFSTPSSTDQTPPRNAPSAWQGQSSWVTNSQDDDLLANPMADLDVDDYGIPVPRPLPPIQRIRSNSFASRIAQTQARMTASGTAQIQPRTTDVRRSDSLMSNITLQPIDSDYISPTSLSTNSAEQPCPIATYRTATNKRSGTTSYPAADPSTQRHILSVVSSVLYSVLVQSLFLVLSILVFFIRPLKTISLALFVHVSELALIYIRRASAFLPCRFRESLCLSENQLYGRDDTSPLCDATSPLRSDASSSRQFDRQEPRLNVSNPYPFSHDSCSRQPHRQESFLNFSREPALNRSLHSRSCRSPLDFFRESPASRFYNLSANRANESFVDRESNSYIHSRNLFNASPSNPFDDSRPHHHSSSSQSSTSSSGNSPASHRSSSPKSSPNLSETPVKRQHNFYDSPLNLVDETPLIRQSDFYESSPSSGDSSPASHRSSSHRSSLNNDDGTPVKRQPKSYKFDLNLVFQSPVKRRSGFYESSQNYFIDSPAFRPSNSHASSSNQFNKSPQSKPFEPVSNLSKKSPVNPRSHAPSLDSPAPPSQPLATRSPRRSDSQSNTRPALGFLSSRTFCALAVLFAYGLAIYASYRLQSETYSSNLSLAQGACRSKLGSFKAVPFKFNVLRPFRVFRFNSTCSSDLNQVLPPLRKMNVLAAIHEAYDENYLQNASYWAFTADQFFNDAYRAQLRERHSERQAGLARYGGRSRNKAADSSEDPKLSDALHDISKNLERVKSAYLNARNEILEGRQAVRSGLLRLQLHLRSGSTSKQSLRNKETHHSNTAQLIEEVLEKPFFQLRSKLQELAKEQEVTYDSSVRAQWLLSASTINHKKPDQVDLAYNDMPSIDTSLAAALDENLNKVRAFTSCGIDWLDSVQGMPSSCKLLFSSSPVETAVKSLERANELQENVTEAAVIQAMNALTMVVGTSGSGTRKAI